MNISENIKNITFNIEKACAIRGINPDTIELVGVTKTVSADRIKEALDTGLIRHIGENRVQEFIEKYDFYKEEKIKKSIIGHLQTNKVKYIIDKVDLIQSVDSYRLAEEINKQAIKNNKIMDILLEINIGEEESKFGMTVDEVYENVYKMLELKNIRVKGLMSIPPVIENEITQRKYFEKLYKIYIDIGSKKIDNIYMDIMSMGMSNDYYYAILEGANMVRVGSAIFGKR